jgi:protein-S-isoprenylcysteine O-methyltransferase Ste14
MKEIFEQKQERGTEESPTLSSADFGSLNVAARASLVNRTHRIVRERAKQMSTRRKKIRSLMAPLAVSAALLVILVTAVWTLLDEYEVTPTGVVDSSDQYMVLAFWFLPLSVALLGMVWFTRVRGRRSGSEFVR